VQNSFFFVRVYFLHFALGAVMDAPPLVAEAAPLVADEDGEPFPQEAPPPGCFDFLWRLPTEEEKKSLPPAQHTTRIFDLARFCEARAAKKKRDRDLNALDDELEVRPSLCSRLKWCLPPQDDDDATTFHRVVYFWLCIGVRPHRARFYRLLSTCIISVVLFFVARSIAIHNGYGKEFGMAAHAGPLLLAFLAHVAFKGYRIDEEQSVDALETNCEKVMVRFCIAGVVMSLAIGLAFTTTAAVWWSDAKVPKAQLPPSPTPVPPPHSTSFTFMSKSPTNTPTISQTPTPSANPKVLLRAANHDANIRGIIGFVYMTSVVLACVTVVQDYGVRAVH